MPIRIVVADDHEPIRQGVRRLFLQTEFEVVEEAATGSDTIEKVSRFMPDVLITDVRFQDEHGIQVVEKVRQANSALRVIVYSAYDNPTYVARMALLGISDYVLKSRPARTLYEAVERTVQHGALPADSELAKIRESLDVRRMRPRADLPLTRRESQVLRHLALGLSNREIGVSLEISIETVKEHVQNILRKLNATDRTQAAVMALKQGLVGPDQDDPPKV